MERSPYRVLISEVMLQQTQSSVVIDYFSRWMEQFPTIEALAAASQERVLKAWEGLGYYSRARRLHQGAHYIVEHYGGKIPSSPEALEKIPGIGPYTVGAILSFAFHTKSAALDGNTIRVLSRFFAIEGNVDQSPTRTLLWKIASEILPDEEPWVVTEALIELGALLCKKTPQCIHCPLRGGCIAFSEQRTADFPVKSTRAPTVILHRMVGIIHAQGRFLVEKREGKKVMSDLYEFPYIEEMVSEIAECFSSVLGMPLIYQEPLSPTQHTFTRYRAHLFPHVLQASEPKKGLWKTKEELLALPFSSGHRRILNEVCKRW